MTLSVRTVIQACSEMLGGNALYNKLLPFEQRMQNEDDNNTRALLTKQTRKGGSAR